MVKTNAEKQKDYREQVKTKKKNSDYLKKDKERKEQRERAFEEILCTVSRV